MTPEEEIQDSLEFCKELEQVIGKPLTSIETPELSDNDFSINTVEQIKPELEVEPNFRQDINPKVEQSIQSEMDSEEDFTFDYETELTKEKEEKLSEERSFGRDVTKGVLSILICVVIAFFIAYFVTHFVVHHTVVEGTSMETTLQNDDVLLIEKVSYYFHDPQRYDIVTFPYSKNVYYIKRVIGLPGETIQIIDGYVYINGQKLDEHYSSEVIADPGLAKDEIKLGKDEYFVLGDNRNASIDSRKEEVGVVKRKNISGKAWLRIYPFGTFGFIKHE